MLDITLIALLVSAIIMYVIFYFIPDKKVNKTKHNKVVTYDFDVIDVDLNIDERTIKEIKHSCKRVNLQPMSDRVKKLLSSYVKNDKDLMLHCDDSIYKIATTSLSYFYTTLKKGKSLEKRMLLEKVENFIKDDCEIVLNKDDSYLIAFKHSSASKVIYLLKRGEDEIIFTLTFMDKKNIDGEVFEEGFSIKVTMGSL